MATSNIKGFYRQRKTSNRPSAKSSKITDPGLSLGSSAALISHGSIDLKDNYEAREEVLRQFDLNMSYGPCLGLTRLERWERANNLGLNPPKSVEILLNGGNVGLDCLWEGRV